MLLQNLTLLNNDAVVRVTNIRAPNEPEVRKPPVGEKGSAFPPLPSVTSPLLLGQSASPAMSTQIIVSIGTPGDIGSTTVFTGEPTITGLEAARRAAQAAAERARLSIAGGERPDAQARAADAYAEAGDLVHTD